jgi:pimeloyl-ACP methyl ester carboxylesterase
MFYNIKERNGFKYIDEGEGQVMILLHGLFGALSNWNGVIEYFSKRMRVVVPTFPIQQIPLKEARIEYLKKFIEDFVELNLFDNIILIGNSLGGHVGLLYTLAHNEKVSKLVLTGSSGLFESSLGGYYPHRRSYNDIRERVARTFYDPSLATDDLVNQVFETTTNILQCLRIISIAKSAMRNNLANDLPNIVAPTLLIWGLNDTITPPMVAHEFNRLIPDSSLNFIDKCCHVPMMEHPEKFNQIVDNYLFNREYRRQDIA